jgi:hypothetical protein
VQPPLAAILDCHGGMPASCYAWHIKTLSCSLIRRGRLDGCEFVLAVYSMTS